MDIAASGTIGIRNFLKTLTISPQAGMCNRFRAICSAILMGKLSNRKVRHNWIEEPAYKDDIDIIRQMRESTFTTFFTENPDIPFIALDKQSIIDVVFSEWGPSEPWFSTQSSAITRCNSHDSVRVERSSADAILQCSSDNILLETSLALKPSFMSEDEFERNLHEIYTSYFLPLKSFITISNNFSKGRPYAGIHIRRTDHLKYIDKAHISVAAWVNFISKQVDVGEAVYICSDDKEFAERISNRLSQYRSLELTGNYDKKSKAFLDFLCLSRATRIFGTTASSFSREAALFGNRPITICSSSQQLGLLGKFSSLFLRPQDTIEYVNRPQPQLK